MISGYDFFMAIFWPSNFIFLTGFQLVPLILLPVTLVFAFLSI